MLRKQILNLNLNQNTTFVTKMDQKNEDEIGFELTTELRLGLPGRIVEKKKRVFTEMTLSSGSNYSDQCESGVVSSLSGVDVGKIEDDDDSPAVKSQVVGWPPVCSYRRKNSTCKEKKKVSTLGYVKVSMDGVPYLRKMDLASTQSYHHLAFALDQLFGFPGIGVALKDGENCEYVTIYEDKDGDWMLAGDVPWRMFIESCKRLRIMKRSDATGFGVQPRGVEE